MKKVLSTVAALGLVAGLASTASAVEFKMSGKYLVEGAYLSDARGNGVDLTEASTESTPSDAYWLHTFEINPTMKVNDKISMSSVIRLADDTFWGTQADGDTEGYNMADATANTNNNVYVHQLYMDYASPIGKTRFGRTPAGTYGTDFMDFNKRANRVVWFPSFLEKPWSAVFYLEKAVDNFQVTPNASDTDSDKYVARLFYKTDSLDSGIEYAFANNQTGNTADDVKQNVTVYGKYKMDNFFLNGELIHYFGSKDYDHALVATADQDYDSWAGMLQVGAKIDVLTPSLMYFYAQGQDRTSTDIENALATTGTGDMFEPLYILTGRHTGMLNNDLFRNNYTGTLSTAGVHAVVAAVNYAVSNQLSLHGAIGWAQADEAETATYTNRDDEYGWEYNVGAAYKLLDNLTYEAHFGYLDTGDFFNSTATANDAENIYLLTHSLTMTF